MLDPGRADEDRDDECPSDGKHRRTAVAIVASGVTAARYRIGDTLPDGRRVLEVVDGIPVLRRPQTRTR
jgi:hypothetical protein